MTQPVHIPHNAPDLQTLETGVDDGVKFRLTVDADGGPSRGVCQGLFYLDGGHSEQEHVHDVDETLYVILGDGHLRLADRQIAIAQGDTVYIPAGTPHGLMADDGADLTVHFTFQTDRFADVTFEARDFA